MRLVFLLTACLCVTGCRDEDARKYAAELVGVVDAYIKQLSAKLGAETMAYDEEARLSASDAADQAARDLTRDLNLASIQAGSQLKAGTKTGKDILASTLARTNGEFTNVTRLYTRGDDAHLDYMKNLLPLTVDLAQAKALRAVLVDLSREPNLLELAGQYTKFATDLDGHLNFHRCESLNTEAGKLEGRVKTATAAVATETDVEKKKSLQAALNALNATLADLQRQRTNTERFDATSKTCTRPQ